MALAGSAWPPGRAAPPRAPRRAPPASRRRRSRRRRGARPRRAPPRRAARGRSTSRFASSRSKSWSTPCESRRGYPFPAAEPRRWSRLRRNPRARSATLRRRTEPCWATHSKPEARPPAGQPPRLDRAGGARRALAAAARRADKKADPPPAPATGRRAPRRRPEPGPGARALPAGKPVIKEKFGTRLDGLVRRLFPFLFWRRLNPNVLSVIGALVSVGAASAFLAGHLRTGGWLMLAAASSTSSTAWSRGTTARPDLRRVPRLDARPAGRHGGARRASRPLRGPRPPRHRVVAGVALVASVLVSYAKARAEVVLGSLDAGVLRARRADGDPRARRGHRATSRSRSASSRIGARSPRSSGSRSRTARWRRSTPRRASPGEPAP